MALPVWGLLPKSQTDPEKIEEAIARMIEAHNEDPEAHLGPNGSLFSHKASEIIDHRALSIVEDKIKNRQVTLSKLNYDKLLFQIQFESLDSWVIENTGNRGLITLQGGGCYLSCGDQVGDVLALSFENLYVRPNGRKNYQFQLFTTFEFATMNGDLYIGVNDVHPWNPSYFSGFKTKNNGEELYAVWGNDGPVSEHRLDDRYINDIHLFSMWIDANLGVVHWEIDGEEVWSFSPSNLYFDNEVWFYVALRRTQITGFVETWLFNPVIMQDL